jgi:tRNA (guanosine-2'-O-)-methyltransferase
MSDTNSGKTPPSSLTDDAWDLLAPKLTPERRQRMEEVARHRTDRLRLVLQDIHDPHNISACFRSAEALGIYQIDLVNLYQEFARPSSVARGSAHWLDISKFNDLGDYCEHCRQHGYKIAVGYPGPNHLDLEEIPLDNPVAVVFGNEHRGVADSWLPLADYQFKIPMVGMVESFNISVSAAITMYSLRRRYLERLGDEFYVPLTEQKRLLNSWIQRHSRNFDAEVAQLRKRNL